MKQNQIYTRILDRSGNSTKAVNHTSRATGTIKQAQSLKDHDKYKGFHFLLLITVRRERERAESSSNLIVERKYDERI